MRAYRLPYPGQASGTISRNEFCTPCTCDTAARVQTKTHSEERTCVMERHSQKSYKYQARTAYTRRDTSADSADAPTTPSPHNCFGPAASSSSERLGSMSINYIRRQLNADRCTSVIILNVNRTQRPMDKVRCKVERVMYTIHTYGG